MTPLTVALDPAREHRIRVALAGARHQGEVQVAAGQAPAEVRVAAGALPGRWATSA